MSTTTHDPTVRKTSLNASQQQAVESDAATLLCLAGPGAGKTKTLVERIRNLTLSPDGIAPGGYAPQGMVAITFTQNAAHELQARLGEIKLGYCGTLHGFLLGLLQRHGEQIGFSGRLTVLDEEQRTAMLEQVCEEQRYRGTKKELEAALALGPQKKSDMPAPTLANLGAMAFFQRLRKANLLTFDTILHYGLRLVQEHPYVTSQYNHVLIDEVQDSSDLDFAIYDALMIPNKFMVGDVDQAVYSFRGGNVENINALATTPGVEVIKLEQNYRSDTLICEAAQRLIQHNWNRVEKATVPVSREPGVAHADNLITPEAELRWIASEIRQAGDQTIAVLVRTNNLVERFTLGLESYGIQVAKRQRVELPLDWKVCKNFLALLNDPENDVLAGWFIEQTIGREAAGTAQLFASMEGLSINASRLNLPDITLANQVPSQLAMASISRESIEAVVQVGKTLPEAATVSDLLLALALAQEPSEQVSEGVTVCTIHASKGKEWDTVFLPAFEQEILPGTKAEEIEESRRLAFVAMTRARHRLAVTYCETRQTFGAPKPVTPSQFLREAGLL